MKRQQAAEKISPEEMARFVAEDKRAREKEFLEIMQREAQRLRVEVMAVIDAVGSVATAKVVVKSL